MRKSSLRGTRCGMGLPSARRRRCVRATPIVGVVLAALVTAPNLAGQTVADPATENTSAGQSTAHGSTAPDLQDLVRPLLQTTEVRRVAVLAGGGQTASVGEPGTLVYSNTRGPFVFGPFAGGGIRFADDIATTGVAGCSLDRYIIRVSGDKDASGDVRPFTATVALYDSCPGAVIVAEPIPGTECHATIVPTQAGQLHDVECVIPADVEIPLPPTMYVAVTFDRGNTGWVHGAPAERGFSIDRFDFPGFECAAALGGFPSFPHASFYTQIFVRDCGNAFPAYRNTKQSGDAFTPGRLIRFADDITLARDDCKMVAYEVSVKGSCSTCSGAFEVDLKTALSDSDPATGNRIPGTDKMEFVFTNKIQVFRFGFDPPIPVPQSFFVTFRTGSDVVGPIVTGRRADLGDTEDTYWEYQGTAPAGAWSVEDFGHSIWSAFDVTVFCEGDPPAGACCDTILTRDKTCRGGPNEGTACVLQDDCRVCAGGANDGEACFSDSGCPGGACPRQAQCVGEAVCGELPEMNCASNRWIESEACDPDPFTPACGLAACCTPDDTCENLTFSECTALPPVERVRRWSPLSLCETLPFPCPFNACLQREGDCRLARPGAGCKDPFCCTDVCAFDPFCCLVEWDRVCLRWANEFCNFNPAFNDKCDGPTDEQGVLGVQANETVFIGNRDATTNSEEPGFCCDNETPGNRGRQTLWFEFAATQTSTRISTCGSDLPFANTLIQVFRVGDDSSRATACETIDAIACNDDATECDTGTLSSVCATDLVVGETYIVTVGTKIQNDNGVLEVDFRSPCTAPPPLPNDRCEDAMFLGGSTIKVDFDLSGEMTNTAPVTFDCPGPFCGRPSFPMANDAWYDWVAPATGQFVIDTCGGLLCVGGDRDGLPCETGESCPGGGTCRDATPETTMVVYQGCDCPVDASNEIDCSTFVTALGCFLGSSSTIDAVKDTCYKIRLGGRIGHTPMGDLKIQMKCPSGAAVTFLDPLNGVVDAGQPHEPDDASTLRGIQSVVISGPAGFEDSVNDPTFIHACWSLCDSHPSVAVANEITSITDNGNGLYTVNLLRPMTPGAVTTLTYTDGVGATSVGTFTVHPGNVNADALTNAEDVAALIAVLRGKVPPPWDLFSADIDRSGSLGPGDLLRLMDLLNGSEAFAPGWNGVPLPESPGDCPN